MLLEQFEPEGKFVRVSLSIPEDALEAIDRAAEAANETRSHFLVRAALLRMDQAPMVLNPADLEALANLLGGKK